MVLHYLFLLGICVEAITGAIAAGRKKMDFFGVILIACLAGLGGGTVRDVLFNTHPITWVQHPQYLLYTSLSAIFTIYIAHSLVRVMKVFLVLDALGLSAFVVIGTQKLLSYHMAPGVAIIGGMVTGICGGMLRDILCNDIPLVLRKELYAVIALLGAILYVVLSYLGISKHLNILITLVTVFSIRIWAIFYHVEMPKFDYASSLKRRKTK